MNKIASIEDIDNLALTNVGPQTGNNGASMGIGSMINAIAGYGSYEGYKVTTESETYHVLIDNQSSCCESWGHICSEDNPNAFIGADLREVRLTDTAHNQAAMATKTGGGWGSDVYGLDCGGIQFVDFITDRGTFQLSVYNSHNGYYGHSIVIAKDDEILLSDTL